MPLTAIATAFARVAAPDDLAPNRAAAAERLANAIAANPFMIAGSGRLGYELNQLCGDRILVKSGAAGVYTAVLRGSGLGLALKIDDGDGPASEVAMVAVLQHLQQLRTDELEQLEGRIRVPITNTRDEITGYRQAVDL
jgi:L-asparaginase II